MLYGPYDSTGAFARTAEAWPVRCGLAPCSRMVAHRVVAGQRPGPEPGFRYTCSVWNSTHWNWTARCSWTGPRDEMERQVEVQYLLDEENEPEEDTAPSEEAEKAAA